MFSFGVHPRLGGQESLTVLHMADCLSRLSVYVPQVSVGINVSIKGEEQLGVGCAGCHDSDSNQGYNIRC